MVPRLPGSVPIKRPVPTDRPPALHHESTLPPISETDIFGPQFPVL